MRYELEVEGRRRQVQVTRTNGRFDVEVDGRRWSIDAVRLDAQTLSLLIEPADPRAAPSGGQSAEIILAANAGASSLTARVDGTPVQVTPNTRARQRGGGDGAQAGGPQRLMAPMPGKVVRVLVAKGDTVIARQAVVVVEAMKMENELRATRAGRVTEVVVRDGQSVEAGALLAVIADS